MPTKGGGPAIGLVCDWTVIGCMLNNSERIFIGKDTHFYDMDTFMSTALSKIETQ